MTIPKDDHAPEPPEVARVTAEAQRTVEQITTLLQAAGWDVIVLSVSRATASGNGEFHAPGATATVLRPDVPIKRLIGSVLRKQADMLERVATDDDELTGYIQDITNYSSGMARWPV